MGQTPDLLFFKSLAAASAAESLPFFRTKMAIDNKLVGGFDPVTQADKNVETALRALIEARFPDHGILGEEFGLKAGDGIHQWVIDPIDGTRAFISGLPVWGVLCGLTINGIARHGMMYQPYTKELYCTDDENAWLIEGVGQPQQLSTKATTQLCEATLFTTSPHLYQGEAATRFAQLEARSKLFRYGCDCYAFAMLASGHADLVVEPGLKPYDIVGLIAVIEKAGGVVTQWDGGPAEAGGDIIAAASPALHAAALDILAR